MARATPNNAKAVRKETKLKYELKPELKLHHPTLPLSERAIVSIAKRPGKGWVGGRSNHDSAAVKEKHGMRHRHAYAVTIRERECYFLSTISVHYYLQNYLQRTDDKDKNKKEKGPKLHHRRKGSKARHQLFMEKAGNQSIR